eukprot:Colp12_sorted_trinity150504_noHs@26747
MSSLALKRGRPSISIETPGQNSKRPLRFLSFSSSAENSPRIVNNVPGSREPEGAFSVSTPPKAKLGEGGMKDLLSLPQRLQMPDGSSREASPRVPRGGFPDAENMFGRSPHELFKNKKAQKLPTTPTCANSPYYRLHSDVLEHILSCLEHPKDVMSAACVNSMLRDVSQSSYVWFSICKRKYCPTLRKRDPNVDYRALAIMLAVKDTSIQSKGVCLLRATVIFPPSRGYGRETRTSFERVTAVGLLLRDMGHYVKSEYVFQRAFETAINEYGPKSEQVGDAIYHLSLAKGNQGKNTGGSGSSQMRQQAVDIYKEVLGPMHPKVANAIYSLADVHYVKMEYDQAEKLYREALRIRETSCPDDQAIIAESYSGLGLINDARGNYEEAERCYLKALTIREKIFGRNHPKVARVCVNLGAMYKAKGELHKVIPLYERAHAIRLVTLGKDHPYTKRTEMILADTRKLVEKKQREEQEREERRRQEREQMELEQRMLQAQLQLLQEQERQGQPITSEQHQNLLRSLSTTPTGPLSPVNQTTLNQLFGNRTPVARVSSAPPTATGTGFTWAASNPATPTARAGSNATNTPQTPASVQSAASRLMGMPIPNIVAVSPRGRQRNI